MVYVIGFLVYFVLYTIIRTIILKVLIYKNKLDVSLSLVNTISGILSFTIMVIPSYIYIDSNYFNTKNLEISNLKFEKSVKIKTVDLSGKSKTTEELLVYYSLDLKNNDESIKRFELSNDIILNKFNNMGGFKEIVSNINFYDESKKLKEFDDIVLLNQNESLKGYGFIRLEDEEISWFTKNIPFETEMKFKISGGTSSDNFKYNGQSVKLDSDISKFKEFIVDSYNDKNGIVLEYQKDDYLSPVTLKNNLWSKKRKEKGENNTSLTPEKILEYLFF